MADLQLFPSQMINTNGFRREIPYGVHMINAKKMWDLGFKGKGVTVAVLDTGCQPDHPDLRGRIIGGRNFTADHGGDPSNYSDNHFHGTHVAGTIAANLNGFGVAGVAPEAQLLILKVIHESGASSYDSLIRGIYYAINWRGPNRERVRVISMSLGGPVDDPRLHAAVKRAVSKNILVVCAAGNLGDGQAYSFDRTYPGYYPEVVCVGAITEDRKPADFTNTNDEIDLVAPGVNITSTYLGSKYARSSGTSMATPHVSGAAALLIQGYEAKLKRRLSEREIYNLLMNNTERLEFDRLSVGRGLLDLSKGIQGKRNS
ncbi:S8 family peptidase [Pseudalkalibacillus berkeleyi]|uniref:S8 family peptidase n=1 Tax=Pseudalkalibacillus berkeleyi TaxID=1069813 RepID=A0ABS9H009_9BACL|nr:S8 family peptidase [Pseudalkalibacillus berkeleyi]MCF6137351.1 S8 family peptidase [Pseudalkalibacillus berkeleyi]